MLTLDIDLPPGALLMPQAAHPGKLAAERGIVWFSADLPECQVVDGRVQAITAIGGGPVARPVEDNTGNCRHVVADGSAYLSLTERTACGFSAKIGSVASVLSFAVIFVAPKGPARTLAALAAEGSRDYIALSQDARALTLARRNGAEIEVTCPPSDWPVLVLARVDTDGLWLAQNDGPPIHAADPEALPTGVVVGFIGCRRQRAGLYKTLGAGNLYDIAFMPDIDVFSPALDTVRAAMLARTKEISAHGV